MAPETAYLRSRRDAPAWRPLLERLLERLGLPRPPGAPMPGENATYPTFLWGDLALKCLGGPLDAPRAHAAERAALELLTAAGEPLAPALLASAPLEVPPELGGGETPWQVLVTARVPGVPWSQARPADPADLAAQLGATLARIQVLGPRPAGIPTTWPGPSLEQAFAGSAFPPHLLPRVPAFLEAHPPGPGVLCHADLVGMHVFHHKGLLTGLIDWGDATWTDPHHELGKPLLGMFRGDPRLQEALLEGAGWTPAEDFPRRVLAQALRRQAEGRGQHLGFDLFHRVPEILTGQEPATLDELAARLFGEGV